MNLRGTRNPRGARVSGYIHKEHARICVHARIWIHTHAACTHMRARTQAHAQASTRGDKHTRTHLNTMKPWVTATVCDAPAATLAKSQNSGPPFAAVNRDTVPTEAEAEPIPHWPSRFEPAHQRPASGPEPCGTTTVWKWPHARRRTPPAPAPSSQSPATRRGCSICNKKERGLYITTCCKGADV
jgi:hypothetical protein